MEADGLQAPKRRRRTKYLDSGSPEPKSSLYPGREGVERITSSPQTDGFLVDDSYEDPPRPKSSTVRMGTSPTSSISQVTPIHSTTSIPRRQATRQLPPRGTRQTPPPQPKRRLVDKLKQMHWLFLIGLGMICALVLWLVGSAVLAWGTQRYYDVRYGNPRTYQTDAVVGHGDSPAHPSHFLAINLNGQAIVIELESGNLKQSQIYPIATMNDTESPVTVSFKDVNGDGKPDMIVQLPGQSQPVVWINTGTSFQPAGPNDNIHL